MSTAQTSASCSRFSLDGNLCPPSHCRTALTDTPIAFAASSSDRPAASRAKRMRLFQPSSPKTLVPGVRRAFAVPLMTKTLYRRRGAGHRAAGTKRQVAHHGVFVVASLSQPLIATRYKWLILLTSCCETLRQRIPAQSVLSHWCPRRDSNPHVLANIRF